MFKGMMLKLFKKCEPTLNIMGYAGIIVFIVHMFGGNFYDAKKYLVKIDTTRPSSECKYVSTAEWQDEASMASYAAHTSCNYVQFISSAGKFYKTKYLGNFYRCPEGEV